VKFEFLNEEKIKKKYSKHKKLISVFEFWQQTVDELFLDPYQSGVDWTRERKGVARWADVILGRNREKWAAMAGFYAKMAGFHAKIGPRCVIARADFITQPPLLSVISPVLIIVNFNYD